MHVGADNSGPSAQLLHRVLLLAFLSVRLSRQLLLPRNAVDMQPIQMIVTALIFIMVLILLWQTFPLRYGLLTQLIQ